MKEGAAVLLQFVCWGNGPVRLTAAPATRFGCTWAHLQLLRDSLGLQPRLQKMVFHPPLCICSREKRQPGT